VEWFDSAPQTHDIGSAYVEANSESYFLNAPLRALYDGLVFVENTSAAMGRSASHRIAVSVLAHAANTGFEDSAGPNRAPANWIAAPPLLFRASAQPDFGFAVSISTEKPYAGMQCAEVARLQGSPYGEAAGGLGQRIDATPYRQRRIRLKAAVRAEVGGWGNQAHLWLIAERGGEPLRADAMLDRPITSSEWRLYSIDMDVPATADHIDYGLALVGSGRAWLEDVSITAVAATDKP
jgi:hypothetical protein